MNHPMPALDKATHTYTLDNETIVGVTSILEPIISFDHIPLYVLERKSKIGTFVHLATELYDENNLDFDSLDSVLSGYVTGWIKFIDDTGFVIEQSEHVVYHDRYKYAGTLDRVGIINNCRAVIDIKCVALLTACVGVQLAAYQEAENTIRQDNQQIKKRFAVQLKPNGSYKLQEYTGKSDFKVFTSLLTLDRWRKKHGPL